MSAGESLDLQQYLQLRLEAAAGPTAETPKPAACTDHMLITGSLTHALLASRSQPVAHKQARSGAMVEQAI